MTNKWKRIRRSSTCTAIWRCSLAGRYVHIADRRYLIGCNEHTGTATDRQLNDKTQPEKATALTRGRTDHFSNIFLPSPWTLACEPMNLTWPMTYEPDLEYVKMYQNAKYLGQRWFRWNIIIRTYRQTNITDWLHYRDPVVGNNNFHANMHPPQLPWHVGCIQRVCTVTESVHNFCHIPRPVSRRHAQWTTISDTSAEQLSCSFPPLVFLPSPKQKLTCHQSRTKRRPSIISDTTWRQTHTL